MLGRRTFALAFSSLSALIAGCSAKDSRSPAIDLGAVPDAGGSTEDSGGGDAGEDAAAEAAPDVAACAPTCPDGASCLADGDCTSKHCGAGVCAPATCSDHVRNGAEVDVDCGGTCPACEDGKACSDAPDCASGVCASHVCAAPTCSDGVQNAAESDVDCGAQCTPKCGLDKKCNGPDDCQGGNCASGTCACPADMLLVPNPGGGKGYCVDATEVTRAAYVAYIDAGPDASHQRAECQGNGSLTPEGAGWPWDPADARPAGGLDWCDADAYCASKGRHLCGAIGGGSNPVPLANSPTASQWYNACSANRTLNFPYGNAGDDAKCVGPNEALAPVPTATCVGGYPGLFDMSGSVAEWEDSCDAQDQCLVRGGANDSSSTTEMRCSSTIPYARTTTHLADVGFRCCL